MKHKTLRKSSVLLCLLLLVTMTVAVGFSFNRTSAQALTWDELLEQRTSTDIVNIDGGTDIRTVAQNIKQDVYLNAGRVNLYGIITEMIPAACFYTEGAFAHMGTEWGFVIVTKADASFWNNWLMIVDFSYTHLYSPTNEIVENHALYRMENLLQLRVSTSKNENGYFIQEPHSHYGFEFVLDSIGLSARLYNENQPNLGDEDYIYENDTGDIFSFGRLYWQGYVEQEQNAKLLPDMYSISKSVANASIDIALGAIGYVSPAAKVVTQAIKLRKDIAIKVLERISEYKTDLFALQVAPTDMRVDFLPKPTQKENGYDYSRDILLNQSASSDTLYLGTDKNSNQNNGFIELEVEMVPCDKNSRLQLCWGFTVLFRELGITYGLGQVGQSFELYELDESQGKEPHIFTTTLDRRVTTIAAPTLQAGKNATRLLDQDSYMIYEFEPQAYGRYTFAVEDVQTRYPGWQPQLVLFEQYDKNIPGTYWPSTITDLSYADLAAMPHHGLGKLTFDVNASNVGKRYYIMVYSDCINDGDKVDCSLTMHPPQLSVGQAVTTPLKQTNSGYQATFEFTPNTTGNYRLTDIPDGVTVAVDRFEASRIGTATEERQQGANCYLKAGETYVVILHATEPHTLSFTLGVGGSLEQTADRFTYTNTLTVPKTGCAYVKFVPQGFSGTYNVTLSSVGSGRPQFTVFVFDKDFDLPESLNSELQGNILPVDEQYRLQAGKEYFIGVYGNNADRYDVSVSATFAPPTVTRGNNSLYLAAGDNSFVFTPPIGLSYTFTVTSGNTITQAYKQTGGYTAQPYTSPMTLEGGATYLFVVNATQDNSANLHIEAGSAPTLTLEGDNRFDAAQTEFVGQFTAPTDGAYSLHADSGTVRLYDDALQEVYAANGQYILYRGIPYYVVLSYPSPTVGAVTIELSAQDIALFYNEYTDTAGTKNYTFVNPRAAEVKFIVDGQSGMRYEVQILDRYGNPYGAETFTKSGAVSAHIGTGSYIVSVKADGAFRYAFEYADSTRDMSLQASGMYVLNGGTVEVLAGGQYGISLSATAAGSTYSLRYTATYSVAPSAYARIENGKLLITATNASTTFTLTAQTIGGTINKTVRIVPAFTFTQSFAPVTEGHKSFMAYTLAQASAKANTFSLRATIRFNDTAFERTFVSGRAVVDVTEYMLAENYAYDATVTVSTPSGSYTVTIGKVQIANSTAHFQENVTYSAKYTHLNLSTYKNYSVSLLRIPASVEVLTLERKGTTDTLYGLHLDIAVSDKPLVLTMDSIYMVGPYTKSLITSKRDIIFNCIGYSQLTGGFGSDEYNTLLDGKSAIDMPNNTLTINGSGTLNLCGGLGSNASPNGNTVTYAGNGGNCVEVGNLILNAYRVTITGGAAGYGNRGEDGRDGANGTGEGGNGYDGAAGTMGAYGGDGGMGIVIYGSKLVIYSDRLTVTGGSGGAGGTGGSGGAGGDGAPGRDGKLFVNSTPGGNGGNGGNGGRGGNGGAGGIALRATDFNKVINLSGENYTDMLRRYGKAGYGGSGGTGGAGGQGGPGGNKMFGGNAESGANGSDGQNGAKGSGG